MLAAVRSDGWALEAADEDLQEDGEVLAAAGQALLRADAPELRRRPAPGAAFGAVFSGGVSACLGRCGWRFRVLTAFWIVFH